MQTTTVRYVPSTNLCANAKLHSSQSVQQLPPPHARRGRMGRPWPASLMVVRVARAHGKELTGDPCGRLVACQTARSLRDATISHMQHLLLLLRLQMGYSSAAPVVDYVLRDILSGQGGP
jgi:hypothetical protein